MPIALARSSKGGLDPVSAAPLLKDLGFLVSSDLPDRPGPASLSVALREVPSLRHYDPASVDYWVTEAGRGGRRTLTRSTRMPLAMDYSWGPIRIVDRLGVTNEYLTFGGRLSADIVDGVVVAVFSSPAPLLRRGGHSQDWDEGAETLGAFFSRFLLAVDVSEGFEARAALADPMTRYAAFLSDAMGRYRASPMQRMEQPQLWTILQAEERGIREHHALEWAAGKALWSSASS